MKKIKPEIKRKEESKDCVCREPELAFKTPSMRTDGTYFQYCKKCMKFRDVPKPERVLIF